MLELESFDYLVVGAGLWGSVLAERLASELGKKVLVIDHRPYIGGNCHSVNEPDSGIECHIHGTHIFHTREKRVWDYICRFTSFNTYRHRVLTEHSGKLYQMPIGLATINAFYGLNLRPYEACAFIAAEAAREGITDPANLEEKALSLVGRPLYEAFIKGYTQKQWNLPPKELPAGIITRLPVRTNYNPEYFDDPWQGLPTDGYQQLFTRLLERPNISVQLGIAFSDLQNILPRHCGVFYSGGIDAFFDYRLGELAWRSLRFSQETVPVSDYQGAAVINQADCEVPYTRIHEFRHLHPERKYSNICTVISKEYPSDFTRNAEAYYPVNRPKDRDLLKQYQELARHTAPHVVFGGRLGSYAYLNMDTTISKALDMFAIIARQHAAAS